MTLEKMLFKAYSVVVHLLTGLGTSVQAVRRERKLLTWEEIQTHRQPSSTVHRERRPTRQRSQRKRECDKKKKGRGGC